MNENCESLSIPRKPQLGIFDVIHNTTLVFQL